jgi:hypothetical protein
VTGLRGRPHDDGVGPSVPSSNVSSPPGVTEAV